jgi:hypothetical protein
MSSTTIERNAGQEKQSDVVRRGREIYETTIRAHVEPEHIGEILLIETETGEYEIVPHFSDLAKRLHEKGPSTSRLVMRIGFPALLKRGGGAMQRING